MTRRARGPVGSRSREGARGIGHGAAAARAAALVVLWLACAALTGCGTRSKALPVLGEVPHFEMTDQSGRAVTNDSLRGKVWAAAFVFTRCPAACPRVTRMMRAAQLDAARRGVPLHLVSFSVDPDNDTPDVLRRFAEQYGADLASWSFLTGDAALVKATAEKGFKIAAEGTADPGKADFGIAHGTQLVLVDGAQKIRGYYSTSEEGALGALVTDAARLSP
jgi:protein SCO1/2